MSLCDTYLDDIEGAYNSAWWVCDGYFADGVDWFKDNYSTHYAFNLTWRMRVKSAFVNIKAILDLLITCNTLNWQPERIPYYLRHCIEAEAPDVTMDAILSAMIAAEFDELQKFIGIVDAYRVSLWNKPFNAEFYAALARGFME